MRALRILVLAALVGCPSDLDDDDVSGTPAPADDDDAGPAACAPPLTVAPDHARSLPLDLILFDGEGGTGDYQWALESDGSGGLLNERTGAYLAGNTAPSTDTIRLTDAGCEGEATATVDVLAPMEVLPGDLAVPPGTTVTFAVSEGSGEFACSLSSDGSGALVDAPCVYRAGSAIGVDLVRIEDAATGQFLLREVVVDPSAVLTHDPPRLALPEGTAYRLRPRGGSGYLALDPNPPGVVEEAGLDMNAVGAGHAEVTLTDRYTAQQTTIVVDVAAPVPSDRVVWGDALFPGGARSADLNDDGHTDLVISNPGVSWAAGRGGLIAVYAGTADGLDPTPVQLLGGPSRDDEWAHMIDLADLDGDGLLDLVVGADAEDDGGGNTGAVHVFAGVPGGWFEGSPSTTIQGPRSGVRFGRSVAVCDFDGDGFLDLAAGAFDDENRDADQVANNQGAVYVHHGSAAGLNPAPQTVLWGRERAAGAWFDDPEQRLALYLAAGDVDGDGRCDLAAAAYTFDGPSFNNQGLVVLFHGTDQGLATEPWRAFTQTDAAETHAAELGRAVAMGDVDGDGLDDLAIAAPRQSVPGLNSTQEGRVHLFLATTLAGLDGSYTDLLAADWSYDGDSNGDFPGMGLLLDDLDGDGVDDVVIGAVADEVDGGTNSVGTVLAFLGTSGGLPSTTPAFDLPGDAEGDWFGAWLAALDDYDGDGLADLGVFAARSNAVGIEVGLPSVLATGSGARTDLQWPATAGKHDFGSAITFLPDLDGDGDDELLVGSDQAPRLPEVRRAGRALLYEDPAALPEVLEAWPQHSGDDRAGRDVAPIGDFDGDGYADFAVIASNDHRPGSFAPEDFANPSACPGSRNDVGSAWIFRGSAVGWESTPSFVAFGPQTNQAIQRLAATDVDGDGRADLIFSGPVWDAPEQNNAGGFAIALGRAHGGGGIEVLCDLWTHFGRRANDNLGQSVAGIGDVDGDGCGEFAVGAYREDLGRNDQGTVRVVFGWGAGCARGSAEAITLVGGQNNANLGRSLDGGIDVDADGLPDLAAGADNHTFGGAQVGRAYLLSGAYLATLVPEPLVAGQDPATTLDVTPPSGVHHVQGRVDEEDLGRDVALIPGLNPPYGGLIAGTPGGAQSGVVNTGGARVYTVGDVGGAVGLQPDPLLVFAGESWNIGSRLGTTVAAGTRGGTPWIALGGPVCDGDYVDSGCVYALGLP